MSLETSAPEIRVMTLAAMQEAAAPVAVHRMTDEDRDAVHKRLNESAQFDAETMVARADGSPTVPAPAEVEAETAPDPALVFAEPVADYAARPPVISVPLEYPFTIDGRHVAVVEIHPPTFAQVEGVQLGALSALAMHAAMSGLPLDAIRAMRWPDSERVVGAAMALAPSMRGR